ncbi:MAG: DNA repair protein RecN, partial [Candidatus Eisenbacteria bacterium]|nr:DNA repair protein RecN [Candidatus Eisenbacteria bacterium]
MLVDLWIKNLALVEQASVSLGSGLNVLTGETGAGKSLLVSAIDLALGARGSVDRIRAGCQHAEVVARFETREDVAEKLGMDADRGEVILRRVLDRKGRSRSYCNDEPITLKRLKEIGAVLADLHGQHEQQNILRVETHGEYLDAFAEAKDLVLQVSGLVDRLSQLQHERDELEQSIQDQSSRRELMEFQREELSRAHLELGEEETLGKKLRILGNASKLIETMEAARTKLSELDLSAEALVGDAIRGIESLIHVDPAFRALAQDLETARISIEESSRELERRLSEIDRDPEELSQTETRLGVLRDLQRKYRLDEAGLLEKLKSLENALDSDHNANARLAEIEKESRATEKNLLKVATELTVLRTRSAARLARSVSKELKGLGMSGSQFEVRLEPNGKGHRIAKSSDLIGRGGAERAAFYLTANPGEPPQPLAKVASGGEASRVMLALKNVLGNLDPVGFLIFDEIDTGIGGAVAEAVGSRLEALSKT